MDDAELDDLHARLRRTRFAARSGDQPGQGGVDPEYLSELVSYWVVIVVGAHGPTSVVRVLVFASVSMVVIWGIHVYASVLAEPGTSGLHWRAALAKGLHDELGVLAGAAAW